MKRLLVIDDDYNVAKILRYNLEKEGYSVDVVDTAEEALKRQLDKYSIILFDVTMDELNGFELAKIIKNAHVAYHIPIIYITTLHHEKDLVSALDLGVEDYMLKPLSMEKVRARVKGVLRKIEIKRAGLVTADDFLDSIYFEGLHINTTTKELAVDGVKVAATHLELELLSFLVKNQGRVFSRAELISKIWPEDSIVNERTVDVNITRLRKKIAPYGDHIKTRFGYGYYFS